MAFIQPSYNLSYYRMVKREKEKNELIDVYIPHIMGDAQGRR